MFEQITMDVIGQTYENDIITYVLFEIVYCIDKS